MPSHIILWPTFLYVIGAVGLPRVRRWLPPRRYTLSVLLWAVAAFFLLLLIVSGGTHASWAHALWGTAAPNNAPIRFVIDPLARGFMLLAALVGLGALVGSLEEQEQVTSREYEASLLGVTGGLVALAMADTLLTWTIAILIVDSALLFAIGLVERPKWLVALFSHFLISDLLILVTLLLLWQQDLGVATTGSTASLLLLGAVVFRLAPLPLSLIPLADEPLPQRVMVMLPLTLLGVGGLWLARLERFLAPGTNIETGALAVLGAVGVALSGWAAWRFRRPSVRLLLLSSVQAAWVLWAWAWGFVPEAIAAAWGGALALGALAFHGGRLDFRHYGQLPGAIAALMLVGAPLSAMWQVLNRTGAAAWQQGEAGLLVLGVIGLMTSVVACAQWLLPHETEPTYRSRWVGGSLLVLLSLPFIAGLWGIRVPDLPTVSLDASIVQRLVVPVVGWAGGLWLWRMRGRSPAAERALDLSARVLSFGWAWRGMQRLAWWLLGAIRGVMLLLEGENYGWLVLFLLLALIVLLPR